MLKIFDLTPESIRESSNSLVEAYPEDLNTIWRMNLGLKQRNDTVSYELRLYHIASIPGVLEALPHISIALWIYLSFLATNSIAQESSHFLYLHESRAIFVQQ